MKPKGQEPFEKDIILSTQNIKGQLDFKSGKSLFVEDRCEPSTIKATGATYTSAELASFLAGEILSQTDFTEAPLRVLDPAVGEGELLLALLRQFRQPVEIYGFDTNSEALVIARARIEDEFPGVRVHFKAGCFLDYVLNTTSRDMMDVPDTFDLIIANPPYVRTQVLGAEKAKRLAKHFNLSGRVDLYHAFVMAMSRILTPKGTIGFIVPNSFMRTKGGAAVRAGLRLEFNLKRVIDLGDTKLFDAAVLPAVIIARGKASANEGTRFSSIYQEPCEAKKTVGSALEALSPSGNIGVADGRVFLVRHGCLDTGCAQSDVWRLATPESNAWLTRVADATWGSFGDIGKVKVGVKSGADKVFLPKVWDKTLELHRPLTTHHCARRYRPVPTERETLYPYEITDDGSQLVDLKHFPESHAYLESHGDQLKNRSFVKEDAQDWYKLLVPQNPGDWAKPKLVLRDIAEKPTFWMDLDGTIVNGDCYWLTGDEELLWLALAVGNSTLVERFYDERFNSRLYGGRRRFMTQYVSQFPLPDPEGAISKLIVAKCQQIYADMGNGQTDDLVREIDQLVCSAFGGWAP